MKHTPSLLFGLAVVGAAALVISGCDEDTDAGGASPEGGVGAFDGGGGSDGGGGERDAGGPVVDCPAPAGGPTTHAGDVKDGEVWTAAASPHVVTADVNVRTGAKLTIEPCARVELAKGAHVRVAYPGTPNIGGTVVAEGTAEHPITFAGRGGERWASLYVYAPGTARLAYVTLEGGGGGDFEDGATLDVIGDGALPADPLLFVDHVVVKGSLGTGVWMQRGSTFVAGSHDLTVTASGGDATPFPVQISEHAIDAFPTGTYTGNRIDEILLRTEGTGVAGSGLAVDATLHERGVPYRMGKTNLDDFRIGGDKGPATLTIEAGVVMRFEKGTAFEVQHFTSDQPSSAAVRAIGTAARPIVFTSAAAAPKAGDWRGLWFGGAPLAQDALDHVRVEYAGADCSCVLSTCSNITQHNGAVIFTAQPPGAFITNSVFREIAGHGVTEGFRGTLVNFRPTNTFEAVTGCVETMPAPTTGSCPEPPPACDGL